MLKFKDFISEENEHPTEWENKGTKWKLTHIGTTSGEGKGGRPGSKIHFYAAEHPVKKGAYRMVVKGHTGIMRGTTTSNPYLDPKSENDVAIKNRFTALHNN